jgi:hypothetical protein
MSESVASPVAESPEPAAEMAENQADASVRAWAAAAAAVVAVGLAWAGAKGLRTWMPEYGHLPPEPVRDGLLRALIVAVAIIPGMVGLLNGRRACQRGHRLAVVPMAVGGLALAFWLGTFAIDLASLVRS